MVEVAAALLLTVVSGTPPAMTQDSEDDEGLEPAAFSYSFAAGNSTVVADGLTRVSAIGQLPTPSWGSYPLMFTIDNSRGPAGTVHLSYTATQNTTRTFERSVEVQAGELTTATLAIPTNYRYGVARARGPGITDGRDASLYFNVTSRPQLTVLNIGSSPAFEKLARGRPAYSNGNAQVVTVGPKQAPSDVAAYLGQDLVVVSVDFLSLSEAQRRALEEYTALGGSLLLSQSMRGLNDALPLAKTPSPDDASEWKYGFGMLQLCDGCSAVDFSKRFRTGDATVRPTNISPKSSRYAYVGDGTQPQTSSLLPLSQAPVGRFLFIIALFTLAIGPGSFVVARKRGPSALLVTIPATALVTCGLIIGYSLVRDGFTVHASVQGVTLLDSQHRALTASVSGFYANLSPPQARFPTGVAVVPPAGYAAYGNDGFNAASISFDEGQRFSSDFIPSRTYLEWGFLSVQPSRARLVVKVDGNRVTVQNALGHHIEQVRVQVNDQAWVVNDLDDGQQKLADAGMGTLSAGAALSARVGYRVGDTTVQQLKEGDFLALLDGPGFTPLGGLKLNHDGSRHFVKGRVER